MATPSKGVTEAEKKSCHQLLEAVGQVQKVAASAGGVRMTVDAGPLALDDVKLGDSIATNMMMMGYAYQQGWLPLPLSALRKAIELNGAAVQFNLDAFDLGRLAVVEPAAVQVRRRTVPVADTCDDCGQRHHGTCAEAAS